eukprot:2402655-Amphidinium_carterae.1
MWRQVAGAAGSEQSGALHRWSLPCVVAISWHKESGPADLQDALDLPHRRSQVRRHSAVQPLLLGAEGLVDI